MCDETRRLITELFNVGGERTWLIEMRDSGQLIGTCGLRPVPNEGAGNSVAGREALDGVVDVFFGYLSKPCRALCRLNTATLPA
jgi:hypothetical protein